MTEIEKNCLVEFFNSINEKFEYVVLRNANELPYENFSNDIDILVDENKQYLHLLLPLYFLFQQQVLHF